MMYSNIGLTCRETLPLKGEKSMLDTQVPTYVPNVSYGTVQLIIRGV